MTSLTLTKGSGNPFTVTAPNNQVSNLTYDSAGNVTVDEFGNHLTYDAEDRIVASGAATYLYDGDAYRVGKANGSGTTLYWPTVVAGVIDESNSNGSAFGPQVLLNGLKVWSSDTAGNGRFLFGDHLGSTRVTANAAGAVLDDLDYKSFGNIISNYGVSPSDNHYTFTGYESDQSDNSTNYATFRNLSSYMGFNRPDPYMGSYDVTDPQTLNRYSYVGSRPSSQIDPSGLFPLSAILPSFVCDSIYFGFLCDIDIGGGAGPFWGIDPAPGGGGGTGGYGPGGGAGNGGGSGPAAATIPKTPQTPPDPGPPPCGGPSYMYGGGGCTPVPATKYEKCVGAAIAAGTAGGFARGLWQSFFTEGVSIPIQTGGGAFVGLFSGAVGCAFK